MYYVNMANPQEEHFSLKQLLDSGLEITRPELFNKRMIQGFYRLSLDEKRVEMAKIIGKIVWQYLEEATDYKGPVQSNAPQSIPSIESIMRTMVPPGMDRLLNINDDRGDLSLNLTSENGDSISVGFNTVKDISILVACMAYNRYQLLHALDVLTANPGVEATLLNTMIPLSKIEQELR